MIQHAMAANACLREAFPKGFAPDETHHTHISILQQFVCTDDLDKVFAAANAVTAKEKPTAGMLKAYKYYYIASPPIGLADHLERIFCLEPAQGVSDLWRPGHRCGLRRFAKEVPAAPAAAKLQPRPDHGAIESPGGKRLGP